MTTSTTSGQRAASAVIASFAGLGILFLSQPSVALNADILCTPGQVLIQGSANDDRLRGTRGDDCMVGNDGNDRLMGGRGDDVLIGGRGDDRLAGGAGNDILEPGPGRDIVNGGPGDDLIIIRAACEVEPRMRISGGPGTDTLRSPLSLAELRALGVRVRSIEIVEIVTSPNDGACVETADGVICSCCNDPGADPASGCSGCLPGHVLDQPLDASGDFVGARLPPAQCVPVPSCADLDCGANGACLEHDTGAACACAPGYAGSACEACAPLFDEIAPGACALGSTCARERCGNHGRCILDAGELICLCDDGWDIDDECGGDSVRIGGARNVSAGSGPHPFTVSLANGAHCSTDFSWSLQRGPGSLNPDPADSSRATYTPPTHTSGHADHVTIEATCDNDPATRATLQVTVASNPANLGRSRFIRGECDPKVAAALDEEVIAYMIDNGILGATVGVSYQGDVVCLRGYGYREFGMRWSTSSFGGPLPEFVIEPMKPCTPVRVASVTKPFTRVALRSKLYGMTIPAALGGGVLGDTTPILPILANTIGLGPNGEVPTQFPAGSYGPNYPPFLAGTGVFCNPGNGLIHPNWNQITATQLLDHTSGITPNGPYAFAPTTGTCTGAAGEICGQTTGPGDPTISSVRRMNNDLGIFAYALPTSADIVRWLAGLCPFDNPPAARFRYSNAGFTVAGEIIETLSGQSFEEFVVDFLQQDGIIDLDAPGRPIVYLGQDKGGGPRTYSLPKYMPEAEYYSPRADGRDVTDPVFDADANQWTFPNFVPAPYGVLSFDAMAAHGGLVMNTLAALNFAELYNLGTGLARTNSSGGHNGLLFGSISDLNEFGTNPPANAGNPNGAGCLIRDDVNDADADSGNGLDLLDVEPCDLPPGIRIAAFFNGEPPFAGMADFVRGRHDFGLMQHALRLAAAKVGQTAAEWADVKPLSKFGMGVDCEFDCHLPTGDCVPAGCGDGVLDPGEQCDDGNNVSGDGCEFDCTLPAPPATEPGGYAACAGEFPGTCLGGPCAPREMQFVTDSARLDWFSNVHPDGNYSSKTFCHDFYSMGLPWQEATCVRTVVNGNAFGVCQECGVDTMTGCVCPAPNTEDGGCNMGGMFNGYECVGGRCWQGLPPNWMCTAECTGIYGASGYCYHDDAKGAVCYDAFCDEPVPTYCAEMFGAVCDPSANGCNNDSCCVAECLNDADCTNMGYAPGHQCFQERCRLAP